MNNTKPKIERDMQLRDILEHVRLNPKLLEKEQIEKAHNEVDYEINAYLSSRW